MAKVSLRKKVGCSVAIAVSAFLIIFAFCGRFFNSALKGVANFFVGSFGMAFYGMMIAVIVVSSFLLANKKIAIPKKYIVHFSLLFVEVVLLVHMFSTLFIFNASENFAQYAHYVYNYYNWVPTFGGIVFGMIVFALQKVLTIYGASVVLFGLLAWSVVVSAYFFNSYFTGKLSLNVPSKKDANAVAPEVAESVADEETDEKSRALKILFTPDERTLRTVEETTVFDTAEQSSLDTAEKPSTSRERDRALDILFNNADPFDDATPTEVREEKQTTESLFNDEMGSGGGYFDRPVQQESRNTDPLPWYIKSEDAASNFAVEPQSKQDDVKTEEQPKPATSEKRVRTKTIITEDEHGEKWIKTVKADDEEPSEEKPEQIETISTSETSFEEDFSEPSGNDVDVVDVFVEDAREEPLVEEPVATEKVVEQPVVSSLQEPAHTVLQNEPAPKTDTAALSQQKDGEELVAVENGTAVPGGIQVGYDFMPQKQIEEAQKQVHQYADYVKPPFDLLEEAVAVEDTEQEYRDRAAQEIVKKLAVFGIQVESVGQVVGPTVTRYEFRVLSEKTRMGDFKQYSADLKACLEAKDDIIIQAPITGTNLVGIEVANKVTRTVKLRNLLESPQFQESKAKLAFVIGQEITGEILVGDLSKLPHLLVAGTTGSGKSVFLDAMIISMMYRYSPEYLRFIMVDPKLVELSRFNGIPHMLTRETIITATDALASMDYLISEMESRYMLFKQNGVVNIVGYNAKINPKVQQRLPYLVLVVDELSDLMSVCQKQFEAKLLKLAQKSRAAGIHMVLATQRPDVKTITGTIKTNFACRVALKVASPADSATILSSGGAEKLLGHGDMLYLGEGQASPTRAQGAYVNDDEINALVQFAKEENELYFDENISKQIFASEQPEEETSSEAPASSEEKLDPLCKAALRFWLEKQGGRASIASIQRNLKIGFNRAGRIMDSLQALHYVEEVPSNEPSSRPVRVLVTLEELDTLFPDMEG